MRRLTIHWSTPVVLLELPIYLAIVGAMALIAAQGFDRVRQHLHVLEAVSLATGPKIAMMEYHAVNGSWPISNEEAGVSTAGSPVLRGPPSSARIRNDGAVDVTLMGREAGLTGKVLTVRAWQGPAADSPVAWLCGHASVALLAAAAGDRTTLGDDELPSPCRSHS